MFLRQTQDALAEVAASRDPEFGMHFSSDAQTGVPGMVISEVEYDPARHLPQNIALFSMMETVTGTPHVQLVLPQQPLEVTIISHHEAGRNDLRLAPLKGELASSLREVIAASMPSSTDRIRSIHIGDAKDEKTGQYFVSRDTEVLPAGETRLKTAETVAELCANGLSFVISDFNHNRLPLYDVVNGELTDTVAIKINHPSDLSLPAGHGIVRVGRHREVNTNRPRELAAFNELLARYDSGLRAKLEAAGLAVAQVVGTSRIEAGQSTRAAAADESIAAAVRSLQR